MKIVIDMNLSPEWREILTAEGWSVVHWLDVGKPGAPDVEILAWASQHGYVIFTQDLDFGALLAMTRASGPSVLQLRSQAILPESLHDVVIAAFHQFAAALREGALITVEPDRARARVLPL